jgi:hypothetical protein
MSRVLDELREDMRKTPGTSLFLMGFASTLKGDFALHAFGPL